MYVKCVPSEVGYTYLNVMYINREAAMARVKSEQS